MKKELHRAVSRAVSAVTALSVAATAAVAPLMTDRTVPLQADAEGDHTLHIDSSYKQPNVVFVLLDDTGIRELSCYGNTFNETPNMDKLASQGTKFNNFYTQPVCSPSRSCILTGQGTVRTGITNFLDVPNSLYLSNQEFTLLPDLLQQAGYRTGIIGKWHLSAGYDNYPAAGSPYEAGFDDVLFSEQKHIGYGDYFYPYSHIPQAEGKEGDYLVDAMNEQAVAYIYDHADDDQPFFLMLNHYATHVTLDAPQDTVNYFQEKRGTEGGRETNDRNPYLAAQLKHLDDGIGAIDDALNDLGIADDTIFILTSDNGGYIGVTDNAEYRGGKAQLYEGGLRDPLIMRWPGYSTDSHENNDLVSVIDFYQTLSEAAGIPKEEIPENSGLSMLPLLKQGGALDRDTLYWAYLRETNVNQATQVNYNTALTGGGAIRIGDYKYIESWECYRRELYNLAEDPGETTNIIEDNYEKAEEMARELYSRLKADTVGKVFAANFADNENYRWRTSGSMAKTGGVFSANGLDVAAVTREDLLLFDFDLTSSVKVGTGGQAGVLFRSNVNTPDQDDFTAYAVTLDAKNDTVSLLNLKNKTAYPIARATAELLPNRFYTLRIVTDSDEIRVFVDGTEVMRAYDSSYAHGGVGFYSKYATASFDDLTVTGLAGTRDTTKAQVNLKPGYQMNFRADYHWVSAEPQNRDGVWYADGEALLGTLAAEYTRNGNQLTATINGITAVCRAGQANMTVNSKDYTLPAVPYVEDGVFYVPVAAYADVMQLTVTQTADDVMDIAAAISETVKHDSDRIVYSGTWNNTGGAHRSNTAGAYAELTFSGSGVSVVLDRGRAACICEIWIDGVLVETADAYHDGAINSSVFSTDSLEPGVHTIRVVNTGTHNTVGTGTNLNISRFEITKFRVEEEQSNATRVEHSDEGVTYSSNWKLADNGMRSSKAGEWCEYSFYGTSVEVYLGVGTGSGICEVWIDGVLAGTVDAYNSKASTLCVFASEPLTPGTHTVKVVNTGTKSSASKNTNINIAYFIVRNDGGDNPSVGDANKDGVVGAADITVVARHVAGIELVTDPVAKVCCDMDGNGTVDTQDLTALARVLARIDG